MNKLIEVLSLDSSDAKLINLMRERDEKEMPRKRNKRSRTVKNESIISTNNSLEHAKET